MRDEPCPLGMGTRLGRAIAASIALYTSMYLCAHTSHEKLPWPLYVTVYMQKLDLAALLTRAYGAWPRPPRGIHPVPNKTLLQILDPPLYVLRWNVPYKTNGVFHFHFQFLRLAIFRTNKTVGNRKWMALY